MTSRERVRAVLAGRQPDRVPMDLWGSASRIHEQPYRRMVQDLGLLGYGPLLRPGTTTPYVDYRISDALHCDFRHLHIGAPSNFRSWQDERGNLYDEWGIGRRLIKGYRSVSVHPLQEMTMEALRRHPWPDPADPGRVAGLREQARTWFDTTPYALTATSAVSGLFFEMGQYLCGAEAFLMGLYDEERFVHALMDRLLEVILEIHLRYLEPIAPYIEWIEFTEDLAMQKGLFCGPQAIKKYLAEPHRQLFGEIKRRYPSVKIFFHSCGAVTPIIEEILDWGVDVLNPLQPLAEGMDLSEIKRQYGSRVVFHGGIDIQQALTGPEDGVRLEARRRIDQLGAGGGYILAPTNHIMDDVPTANVVALYREAEVYSARKYQAERNG